MDENGKFELYKTRHKLFLEALRHREQEVLKYLVIIGPALGGFVWLSSKYPKDIDIGTFCMASIGLMSVLLLGASYCIALGYNYRIITFQIAKEERNMGTLGKVLDAWPRTLDDWFERTKLGHYFPFPKQYRDSKMSEWAWCFPPEIICVFWYAFLVGIVYMTVATCILSTSVSATLTMAVLGFLFLCVSLLTPHIYGRKLRNVCQKEKKGLETSFDYYDRLQHNMAYSELEETAEHEAGHIVSAIAMERGIEGPISVAQDAYSRGRLNLPGLGDDCENPVMREREIIVLLAGVRAEYEYRTNMGMDVTPFDKVLNGEGISRSIERDIEYALHEARQIFTGEAINICLLKLWKIASRLIGRPENKKARQGIVKSLLEAQKKEIAVGTAKDIFSQAGGKIKCPTKRFISPDDSANK